MNSNTTVLVYGIEDNDFSCILLDLMKNDNI